MASPDKPVAKKNRWPDKTHDLVHTFGVEDYDEYWRAAPMRKAMRSIHKRMLKTILEFAPPPQKLLELGPGDGHLFTALQEAGYDVYACDASQVALDTLKAPPDHLRLANLNEGCPDFGTRFTGILFALVLHHINKPDVFLEQLRQRLEPGGYLILTIPNIVTLQNRVRMLAGKFPDLSPSHRNFMTPAEVIELLKRARLPVLKCLPARRKLLPSTSPVLFSKELILVARAD